MSDRSCPHEAEVARGARTGEWNESLRAHAAACAVCGEVAWASRWMQSLAQDAESGAVLPDAKLVWWRAQLAERQKRVERAHSALAWFEIAAAALSLGVAAWIVGEGAGVPNLLARLMAEGWPDFWVGVQSLAAVSPVIFSAAAVDLTLVAIALVCLILVAD
jgi:hypothetical protein